MNDRERGELEDRLRHALNEAAARIHPAGDGLERIREQIHLRRRRRAWMRPSLAVVAATAVVALVTTMPLYLHRTDAGRQGVALGTATGPASHPGTLTGGPTQRQATTEPAPSATGGTATPSLPVPSDDAGELPDMTTVWPYGSRREGGHRADQDVADRIHPTLRDPRQTAVAFIESFVGTSDSLVADHAAPLAAGIGVTVSRQREDGNRIPVSLVYLVRVRRGDDAPYVVVEASRPPLGGSRESMSVQPGTLAGVQPVTVTGTVTPASPNEQIALVKVELREPGQDETLASQSPPLTPAPDPSEQQVWSATLTPIRPLSTATGTVAAWTVDAQNHLLSFVAAPTAAPEVVRPGGMAR